MWPPGQDSNPGSFRVLDHNVQSPRICWMDSTKMDLREVRSESGRWMKLPYDHVHLWTVGVECVELLDYTTRVLFVCN